MILGRLPFLSPLLLPRAVKSGWKKCITTEVVAPVNLQTQIFPGPRSIPVTVPECPTAFLAPTVAVTDLPSPFQSALAFLRLHKLSLKGQEEGVGLKRVMLWPRRRARPAAAAAMAVARARVGPGGNPRRGGWTTRTLSASPALEPEARK